jgi:TolA-binding protein
LATHLVKHQKLTKRQIKEDPLVTMAYRGLGFWERNSSRILVGLGVVGLVAVLLFFVLRARSQAEVKAGDDLFKATLFVSQGDYGTATPLLQEIIDGSPGTRAARQAMLYMGDALAAQHKSDEAATWYRKSLDRTKGDRVLQRTGYFALGAALEDAGKFAGAADAYGEAAKRSATDNDRGRAMLSEARSLLRAGQTPKAVETYQAVLALPDADQGITDVAKEQLGEIQAPQP